MVISSIQCVKVTTGGGSDDLVVKVNGRQKFSDEIDDGQSVQPNIQVKNGDNVQLWEADGGGIFTSNWDRIGSFIVNGSEMVTLTGDGSHYEVYIS